MKAGFYPKMATDGMRKNGRLYTPYFVTSILMVCIYYILHFLGNSGVIDGMPGGGMPQMHGGPHQQGRL